MLESNIGSDFTIALLVYLIGIISPGPSNLAIISIAITRGRTAAVCFAMGILVGSLVWGMIASFGVVSLLEQFSNMFLWLKNCGAIYFFFLAFRAARAVFIRDSFVNNSNLVQGDRANIFLRGAALHLTNPKAIFVWLSIISLGLQQGVTDINGVEIVLGCGVLGLIVFNCYAVIFSASIVQKAYLGIKPVFDGLFAVIFGVAGYRMLTVRLPQL